MVGAVSAIRSWGVQKVWGAHATVRRGPTPVRPLEEPTPILAPLRIMVYQLRPDGRLEIGVNPPGQKVDRHV
ncbi:MAG TPA: hypothetical protein VMZ92_12415 [Planctomycetota bacterium]|nr:hypothetical protein [Planctomycetota bacterium]